MKYPEDYINKVICGDNLEIMKGIPTGSIDLILTDPPYNAKNIGKYHKVYEGQAMVLAKQEYVEFCKNWFGMAIAICPNIVFTPGIANVWNYPPAKWIMCWSKPSAVSFNRFGGFNCWEPILAYGKPKNRVRRDVLVYDIKNFQRGPENGHPCPKQKDLWTRLILDWTKEGDTVLDIFSGSGTTALVCKENGRNFICIDWIQEYCEIAQRRLSQEYLFT